MGQDLRAHVAVDDYSRLAYAEALPDERGQTAALVAFLNEYSHERHHSVLNDPPLTPDATFAVPEIGPRQLSIDEIVSPTT